MELVRPTVGRIVHYTLEREGRPPVTRPAIVVHVWDPPAAGAMPLVQLQVFLDGTNDGASAALPGLAWRTSVHYDPDGTPGTWRWPPR